MERRGFLFTLFACVLLTGCNEGKKISDPVLENRAPTRKAVLVGICAYPSPAELAGCVNDVMDMRDELVKFHDYKDSDIHIVIDAQATTEGIWSALNWLIADTQPGDYRFFHYSGHGVQFPKNGVLHQCICPVDFDWSESRMIMDVQFKAHFSKLPRDVVFTWISDSCHSGDLTRGITRGKPKTWPIIKRDLAIQSYVTKKKNKALIDGELDVQFISGCESHQTSADTVQGNRPRGALTWYFLDELAMGRERPVYVVTDQTRANLHRDLYDQSPTNFGRQKNNPFQRSK